MFIRFVNRVSQQLAKVVIRCGNTSQRICWQRSSCVFFRTKNWTTPKIPWVIMGYHHFFLSLPSKSHMSLSFITHFPPEKWPFGHRPRYSYPGSLPRALTLAERERVLRVLQPTATFEMLNRMPAERGCPGTWTWGFFGLESQK